MNTHGHGRSQWGASLLFALLALAAMSLAAVALVRSVDTSSLVVGNIAFKQASVAISGRATEEAINKMIALRAASGLDAEQPGVGYYPVAYEKLDPTGRSTDVTRAVVDWDDTACATPYASGTFTGGCLSTYLINPPPVSQYTVRYVITRLCTQASPPTSAGNACAKPISSGVSSGAGKGAPGYTPGGSTTIDPGPYYRVVVRTTGPRNTVGYSETIVHF